MGYNCVVCVKQVPDTKHFSGETMKEDGTVNRAALPTIFNPEDLHALELALDIRDQYGGTVSVITMGLPKACDVLRSSLFRGADRVILVTDRRAGGSDTLATSHILACAVRKLDPDIVLCGRQAIDGDTAQVGPQMAEKIGFTPITYVDRLNGIKKRSIEVRRNVGNGWEIVDCQLPVLLTVTDEANTPRPPAMLKVMKHKKARCRAEVEQQIKNTQRDLDADAQKAEADRQCEALAERGLLIEQWGLDDIGADLNWCGLAGSPTKVHRVQSIVLKGGDFKRFDPTDEGVAALVGELIRDHTIG
jgi:electron transfer flavoprotein beta subunit